MNTFTITQSFTDREHNIARLLSSGMSVNEVALALEIRPATISYMIRRLYDKSGMSRRVEFVLWYLKNFPQ